MYRWFNMKHSYLLTHNGNRFGRHILNLSCQRLSNICDKQETIPNTPPSYIRQLISDVKVYQKTVHNHEVNIPKVFDEPLTNDSITQSYSCNVDYISQSSTVFDRNLDQPTSTMDTLASHNYESNDNVQQHQLELTSNLNETEQFTESDVKSLEDSIEPLEPPIPFAGNLAAYVPKSEVLQELVKMGVNLSKVEETEGAANMLLRLDIHRHVDPIILYLKDQGVPSESLGRIFTSFPKIFRMNTDELEKRFQYFRSKKFSDEDLVKMVVHHSTILSLSSVLVDKQLGILQKLFYLTGDQLRSMVISKPKLITFPSSHFKKVNLTLSRQMKFTLEEIQNMVTKCPKLLLTGHHVIQANFLYLHQKLELDVDYISQYPRILLTSRKLLVERTKYLNHLGKLQLDPTKELFTPLDHVVNVSAAKFCDVYCSTSVSDYNRYLKTL